MGENGKNMEKNEKKSTTGTVLPYRMNLSKKL
jgi:hypothetical protein